MRGNPGYLFEVKGGGKAIAYHNEQTNVFMALNKVYIHLITDDFTPILDENGKQKSVLKDKTLLKHIGFLD